MSWMDAFDQHLGRRLTEMSVVLRDDYWSRGRAPRQKSEPPQHNAHCGAWRQHRSRLAEEARAKPFLDAAAMKRARRCARNLRVAAPPLPPKPEHATGKRDG